MPAGDEALAEARRFYGDLLGLREVAKPPALAARGGAWFAGDAIAVHLGVEEPFAPARKAHPAFLVEGLDAFTGRLEAASVPATRDDAIPSVRRAYVHDPFGNRLELIEAADAGFTDRPPERPAVPATTGARVPAGRRVVAFATCAEVADLDPDDLLMVDPLDGLGVDVEPATWDDPSVDWDRFDAVILRSTWDYPERLGAFLAWAASVPRLVNPIEIVRWNTDKRYLLDLATDGIEVVSTIFAEPDEPFHSLPADWQEVVVKPASSAGSRDTARYTRDDERVWPHVERLLDDGRVAMLQPYHHGVDARGETGLVYANGVFSHAFRKGPLLAPSGAMTDQLFAPEDISPRVPTSDERALGDAAIAWVAARFGTPVYGRVDLLPGPQVIEVELVEPSLYLAQGEGAADRFAAAIAATLAPANR
jgi:catechol 2,3-dioxygenase-like lactoylglutathione lyase family enzyme